MVPFSRNAILAAVAVAWTGLVPQVQAQWGSIRANNHEHRGAVERAPVRHEEVEHARERSINEHQHWDLDIDRHRGEFWWSYHPDVPPPLGGKRAQFTAGRSAGHNQWHALLSIGECILLL
jgi:hypothetical protein